MPTSLPASSAATPEPSWQSPWYRQDVSRPRRDRERHAGRAHAPPSTAIASPARSVAAILGRGADLIVIDDPIKASDAALSQAERRRVAEFYDNTLYGRLNDKVTGAIVIVMQRLHQDDLVGHVLGKEDWEVVSLPAIAVDDADLSDRRRAMPMSTIAAPARCCTRTASRWTCSRRCAACWARSSSPPSTSKSADAGRGQHHQARVAAPLCTAAGDLRANDLLAGTPPRPWPRPRTGRWARCGARSALEYLSARGGARATRGARPAAPDRRAHRGAGASTPPSSRIPSSAARWPRISRRTSELFPSCRRPRFDKQARLLAQSARFEAGQVLLSAGRRRGSAIICPSFSPSHRSPRRPGRFHQPGSPLPDPCHARRSGTIKVKTASARAADTVAPNTTMPAAAWSPISPCWPGYLLQSAHFGLAFRAGTEHSCGRPGRWRRPGPMPRRPMASRGAPAVTARLAPHRSGDTHHVRQHLDQAADRHPARLARPPPRSATIARWCCPNASRATPRRRPPRS